MGVDESGPATWQWWYSHFAAVLGSASSGEVSAAAAAAVTVFGRGEGEASADAAGRAAAVRYRDRRGGNGGDFPRGEPVTGTVVTAPAPGEWPDELAARLFAIPARWGWQAAEQPALDVPADASPQSRPAWIEPQRPDTSALRRARSTAVTKLVWRLAVSVVLVSAFLGFSSTIGQKVAAKGASAQSIYKIALIVAAGLIVLGVARRIGGVIFAVRRIREFEQPYRVLREAEQQRHRQAAEQWDAAVRRHRAAVAKAETQRADGPLWFPVHPASEPTRVDVFGGDPRRNGWASLLVTLGASVLAAGNRITLLDFTGQDIGGGLAEVARARRLVTRRVDMPSDGAQVSLLDGLARPDVADCLAYALTARPEAGDLRYERALAKEIIQCIIDCLDGEASFARLAASIQVLRRNTPTEVLSQAEVSALAEHVGDFGQDEWTVKQLRFMHSQLTVLHGVAPRAAGDIPLWTPADVTVVTTDGGLDDSKELLDRMLVQLAMRAMRDRRRLTGYLMLAGADHLGAATLATLTTDARNAGVRLLLMIDQPQGDVERTVGIGGAVCIMKMYNHRDANIAADFIGRGYKFVVSQVTMQVGKSFTEGGGDNFSAATTSGTTAKRGLLRERGRNSGLSESRGHTWTGVRNWSLADNLSNSVTSGRVHEFTVDPQQILGMPETAFILIDNSGTGRRVIMADANPGICLLPRVALTQA